MSVVLSIIPAIVLVSDGGYYCFMGVDYKTKDIVANIKISRRYTDIERQAIAAEIIEHIRKRTKRGVDKDGDSFPKYSNEYTKSLDFKIAGKSKSNINLTLSGDMLDAMALLQSDPGKLKIGYKAGTDVAGRAEGNIKGTYGLKTERSSLSRDFLGIEGDQLERILKRYPLADNKREKSLDRAVKKVASFELTEDVLFGEADGE